MQLEDPVRQADALKIADASVKNKVMKLPQGPDVSDVSYKDYSYLTRKNVESIFSQLMAATQPCEVLVRKAKDLNVCFGCSLICNGLNKSWIIVKYYY